MRTSSRFARTLIGAVVLAGVILMAVWFLTDRAEERGPGEVVRRPTSLSGPGAAQEPMVLPVPEPAPEPRTLSAVSADADEPVEAGERVEPRRYGFRHASGPLASGLRVAFQREGETMHVGETNAAGLIDFVDVGATSGSPTGLWIGGVAGLIVGARPPAEAPGDIVWIDLPAGREIEGTVTVDGFLPTRPVDVVLRDPGRAWRSSPPDEAIRQRLARPDTRLSRGELAGNAQRVTSGGRFRFSGLTDDWSGRLYFTSDYSLDPEHHPKEGNPRGMGQRNPDGMEGLQRLDIRLDGEPSPTRLHLALRTRPTLRGRAVWPDGSPAAGAEVSCRFPDASYEKIVAAEPSAADGSFTVACTWKAQSALELIVRAADGRGMASRDVAEAHRAHGVDVGDVVLRPTRPVTFRAIDTEGEPIAGGLGVSDDGSHTRSDRTDAAGLADITLALEEPRFTVHALEYESAEVFAAEESPEVVDVVLEDCCVLRLRFASLDTADDTMRWKVTANRELFTRGQMFQLDPIRLELGHSMVRMSNIQMTGVAPGHDPQKPGDAATFVAGSASFAADPDETVLSCLTPGVAFDVALTDLTGMQVIWEQEDLSLATGEDRLIVAQVEVRARRFLGTVTDLQGLPIEGARIYVGPAGGLVPSLAGDTDAEGHFGVDDLLCDAVDFDCAKKGYLTIEQKNVPIPTGDGIRLTLTPSRSMTVEVTSPAALVKGARMRVMSEDTQVFDTHLRLIEKGVTTRPHRYTCDVQGVAGEEATLQLVNGGRTHEYTARLGERVVYWTLDEDG